MVQILRNDKMVQLTESMLRNWLDKGLYTYEGLKETFDLMATDKQAEAQKLEQKYSGVKPSWVSAELASLYGSMYNYTEALKILEGIKK